MLNRQTGTVKSLKKIAEGLEEALVEIQGTEAKAYVFPLLTGQLQPNDEVLLNTTAVDLKLGSGGYHFVMGKLQDQQVKYTTPGHIMKLRYTPLQLKVCAVEEPASPHHALMVRVQSLSGTPVICGSLHSMLIPCVCGLVSVNPRLKIAYVMTDGGALPLALSQAVASLKKNSLLCGTVTIGHAFGGDYEAVNLYSGLLAAKEILKADVIIVLMGPGVVGTSTTWGNTALEVGQIINAVTTLDGVAYCIPRLSFAEKRTRHLGISHHTLTALGKVALGAASIVLPALNDGQKEIVLTQLKREGMEKHRLIWGRGHDGIRLAYELGLRMSHMGRSYEEDPLFFLAGAATGEEVARRVNCKLM
ncbi:MAG: hypothetical protein JG781_30 [Peptococcaceae bacterium]|nr:hypothetical protein [Peptococcaceae bacterium]